MIVNLLVTAQNVNASSYGGASITVNISRSAPHGWLSPGEKPTQRVLVFLRVRADTDRVAGELAGVLREVLGLGWGIEFDQGTTIATIESEGQTVAAVEASFQRDTLVARVQIGPWEGFDSARAQSLVDDLGCAAVGCGAVILRLDSANLLLRNRARLNGFEGGVRESLILRITPDAQNGSHVESTSSWAVSTLEALLPQSSIRAIWPSSPVRRIIQRALSGSGARIHLVLQTPPGRFDVWVPEREDLMPEPIAMAVDTAIAIKSRFGPALRHVGLIRFDLAHHGMSKNRVAGVADTEVPSIHINAGYCCADLAPLNETRRGGWKPKRPSAPTAATFKFDKIVAHEIGHQLDHGFQGSRYRESIEFRRRLGETLGVPSIEFAVRGTWDEDQQAAARAKALLTQDVSPYATTNLSEAMAELFAVWWFGGRDGTPIMETYDRLIEEYLPRTAP